MASLATSTSPPVRTLSPAQAWPYNPSRLETLFFLIPPEIRHQIYNYVFHTPVLPFTQKTVKGWRVCPDADDLNYNVNGTQLLAINRRIRSEALPILYRGMTWRIPGFPMLREWLNTSINAEMAHLHVRKVSLVDWHGILSRATVHRSIRAEQGSFMVTTLSDLPSLRELELSPHHLPDDKKDYQADEWLTMMSTLQGNGGVLRVVALESEGVNWFEDWSLIGGKNFSWHERLLLRTSVEVHDWTELVEADWGNFDFNEVFLTAMRRNWIEGPLKTTVVEHAGREFKVKFWGCPENVRQSEERKEQRKTAKKAVDERRKAELKGKGKLPTLGMEHLRVSDSDEEGGSGRSGGEGVDGRHRKSFTREEARMKRKERGGK
jgi:hypothetical protein